MLMEIKKPWRVLVSCQDKTSTMSSKNSRRQFLKNIGITSLGVGLIPNLSLASYSPPSACDATTLDYYGEGPFYTANPPEISNGQLADENEAGTRLILSGRAYDLDCNTPLANTVVDVWHADDAGTYDNSGYNLRGFTKTNAQGYYVFETIYPGKYLNGNQYRPAHIHFKITPPNQPTLITQLYFEGDDSIPNDAAASITSGTYDASDRIIPVTMNGEGKLEGVWDINIQGGQIGLPESLHVERGMIYSISPNPSKDKVEIKYGVFRDAKVGLEVYDKQGRLVATLNEEQLSAQKYTAEWTPDHHMASGSYFVVLKVNDIQVHYLKMMRL